MSKEITSTVLGQLKQDAQFKEWWKSGEIAIPFFDNKKLAVTFMDCEPDEDVNFITEADAALNNFLQLSGDYRRSISAFAYKNCMDFLEEVGFDDVDDTLRKMKDEQEIWQFIYPTEIYVTRRPYQEKDMYVQFACECEWEQEHGLQLVFRRGKKLTRISGQDGHLTEADAYDIPDEEDELLSKF